MGGDFEQQRFAAPPAAMFARRLVSGNEWPHLLLFVLLAVPATAGVFAVVLTAALSVMAFDARGSEARSFAAVIGFGAPALAAACVGLEIGAFRLMAARRRGLAYAALLLPILSGIAVLGWLRSP